MIDHPMSAGAEFPAWEAAAAASTRSTARLALLFEIALSIALLYGVNLYFSSNGTINDPVVPMWWPATKDAAFLLLFYFAFLRIGQLPMLSLPLVLVLVCSLTCAAWSIAKFGFSSASAAFSKNLLLYFSAGTFLGATVASAVAPSDVAIRICRAVLLSVVVGFACLMLPIHSLDNRLYGTYGNPTSFGYAVFLAFALMVGFRSRGEAFLLAVLFGFVFDLTGSFSPLLSAGAFLGAICFLEMLQRRAWVGPPMIYSAAIAASVGGFGFISRWLGHPAIGFQRMFEIAHAVTESDSVVVRLQEFAFPIQETYKRYDSVLLSLYKNFGWTPLFLYACLVISLVVAYLRSEKTFKHNAIAACTFCLFVLNPLLQHQMEIFPTNLLFGCILGCSAVWFSTNLRSAR